MTYDYQLTLIGETITEDDIGNQIAAETPTVILCDIKSVGRGEFYNAAAKGLRPEYIFVVHKFEYNGEQLVEFEGKRYNVLRSYAVSAEELELTCEKVLGNG